MTKRNFIGSDIESNNRFRIYNAGQHYNLPTTTSIDRDLVTTVELLDWLKKEARVKVSREVDVANALKQVGGVRVRGCKVAGVGNNVNIWIIRNHYKYKGMTAPALGSKYVGFYTEKKQN